MSISSISKIGCDIIIHYLQLSSCERLNLLSLVDIKDLLGIFTMNSNGVGIWVESPLSLAWIGLARLSKPALLAEHVATVSS